MYHDDIIDEIFNKLSGKKIKQYEYKDRRLHGEVDILSFYNNNLYIFEVKTTNKRKHKQKALEQLLKDYDYFSKIYDPDKTYMFYSYSFKDSYKIELVGILDRNH